MDGPRFHRESVGNSLVARPLPNIESLVGMQAAHRDSAKGQRSIGLADFRVLSGFHEIGEPFADDRADAIRVEEYPGTLIDSDIANTSNLAILQDSCHEH